MDYGQVPAAGEIRASAAIAEALSIRHEIIRVDCSALGSGALVGGLPLAFSPAPEWWPFRNQLLVTLAAMRAVSLGIDLLLIGVVASDSTHSDGRLPFIKMLDDVLAFQEGSLRLEAPALELSTVELIRRSRVPRELLAYAHSCHRAPLACGDCRGCAKYLSVLSQLEDTA